MVYLIEKENWWGYEKDSTNIYFPSAIWKAEGEVKEGQAKDPSFPNYLWYRYISTGYISVHNNSAPKYRSHYHS